MQKRYNRNRIYLSDENQKQIQDFKILLGGAGIGSVVAECALRLGFENITIVDGDVVEESNLNRQDYEMSDLGRSKAEALKDRLLRINPEANIRAIHAFLDEKNMTDIVPGHDVAINALDFKDRVPFEFDKLLAKEGVAVIHPYNIGFGGLAIVVKPESSSLNEISDKALGFEKKVVEYVSDYFKYWAAPKLWIENVLRAYEREEGALPPPQLPIASWIVGGMCTDILFRLATGKFVKTFPKFYYYSAGDDLC
ncbi:MAG: HesA/MoeB/ThiF family protein [Tannerellaceae bacterium]